MAKLLLQRVANALVTGQNRVNRGALRACRAGASWRGYA
jgi:hypothetical protein